MSEFDYQWKHLPSPYIEHNIDRINEFKRFTGYSLDWFKGKSCLDAGCGSGRYTFAMLSMGAKVMSIDRSEEAVKKCKLINLRTYQIDISEIELYDFITNFDFVLSWGVLHHTPTPEENFYRLAELVKPGGRMHVYLYHEDDQKQYEENRRIFKQLKTTEERLALCQRIAREKKWNLHGIWDSLVPEYNWGTNEATVKEWFKNAGFKDIYVSDYRINMNGVKK
jgi:SAM-dependent methyltransferase